ncbi:hypothetical protein NQZ68_012077 [Dissostichus eleginoides]|nr:hypothetical protein NQZ68_012077 [Dissostichus eleginoides]
MSLKKRLSFKRNWNFNTIIINMSWWDHLRSFSMWCLEMPDCAAWGLYHRKASRAFSDPIAKSCSFGAKKRIKEGLQYSKATHGGADRQKRCQQRKGLCGQEVTLGLGHHCSFTVGNLWARNFMLVLILPAHDYCPHASHH